jgi:hypothetical protein
MKIKLKRRKITTYNDQLQINNKHKAENTTQDDHTTITTVADR